jgi:hypothetical protein
LQSLSEGDKVRKGTFCEKSIAQFEEDETLDSHFVFSDEATFLLSGIVIKENVRFWGSENPHASVEFLLGSPKVDVGYPKQSFKVPSSFLKLLILVLHT